jgi:hypothetical protein
VSCTCVAAAAIIEQPSLAAWLTQNRQVRNVRVQVGTGCLLLVPCCLLTQPTWAAGSRKDTISAAAHALTSAAVLVWKA